MAGRSLSHKRNGAKVSVLMMMKTVLLFLSTDFPLVNTFYIFQLFVGLVQK